MRRFPLLLVAVACLGRAADDEDVAKTTPLEGDWAVVLLRYKNKEQSAEELGDVTVRIRGDKLTFVYPKNDKPQQTLTFKLKTVASPKAIDFTSRLWSVTKLDKEAKERDLQLSGIYEASGDELKLCWRMPTIQKRGGEVRAVDPGKPTVRPKAFDGKGANYFILLKRMEAAPLKK